MALSGCTFCITGTLSKGRKLIEADIVANGGSVAGSVTGAVTHVLSTDLEFAGGTGKIAAAMKLGKEIVKEEFLTKAISSGKLPSTKPYLLSGSVSGGGGGGKTKAAAPAAHEPPAKKARKGGKKEAVVNPKSGMEDDAEVFVDDDGTVYDVEMVQQDVATNMDKFYDIQVLVSSEGDYFCFQHWGRAGTSGQTKMDGPNSTPDEVKKVFNKKFREKSGHAFAGSGSDYPVIGGKYTVAGGAKAADSNMQWEYYVDKPVDGKKVGWYPYDDGASKNMERFYAQFLSNAWLKTRFVHSGSWTYEVDFQKNKQTNMEHPAHTTRKIRRQKK
jgi:predicted DNA-binding WGR domain protein|eukprot:TRINITY_DN12199_c0_g1_i1.p1 TRINITY_DN12199_c0_g1~~TRINITY_DN12199_c0_g1_i1.p1  ORF type:complete len:354 (+),score=72.89 TRINITY_DN12199_c0_g1_i1:78-1064(+)